ncbi:MAG: hypothetical protein V4530_06185 [Pseudomonadota bacterium]
MRYAAFDLSSKTGWGVWDGAREKPILGTKQIVGWDYDAGTMLELYRQWLGEFLRLHRPQRIALESWYIAPHLDGKTIGKQIMLSGFTQWACKAAKIPFHLVTAGQWRKTWYGSAALPQGNDWKLMASHRCRTIGWDAVDHNAAEAAGLLDHLITQYGRETPPWRSEHMLMPQAYGVKRRGRALTGDDIEQAVGGLGL